MKQRRALVTGGAGFLGSHLCGALLADGYTVLAVDNLLTGRTANLNHLRNEPRFEFRQLDICDPFDCGEVDFIFHFASPASPVDYSIHGIATLRVGSAGTFNALELARTYSAKYLISSTSECYGDPLEHPQKETYWGNVNPIGPRAVYDEAKRAAEAFTMAYRRAHGMRTRIVRIFNSYGPRMRLNDGRAVPNFLLQALRNQPLTVYGDGSQTRSLCYVDDLIDGVVRLLNVDFSDPINLGTSDEVTILELAKRIRDLCGSSSEIGFQPLPEDDPRQRRPDLTRARQLLGWDPRTTLDAGLIKTIADVRERLARR